MVQFLPTDAIDYAFKMNGGDYYLFANDGSKTNFRNGYGISNESPKANPVSAIVSRFNS
jgi:hypothetical protein